jgi:hypothetical protein
VVAHAGLGGFPLGPASQLIHGARPWEVGGPTVKHVVIGFVLIFLLGLLVLWLLLHSPVTGSGALRYTEWRWIKQSPMPVAPAGRNTMSCASRPSRWYPKAT